MATGDRIGIADKTTLDSVNEKIGNSTSLESTEPTTLFSGIKSLITSANNTDLKVGTDTDAASTTPVTLFSGVKSIISRVTNVLDKVGNITDSPSESPTTLFSGIKGLFTKIDTVASTQKRGINLSKYNMGVVTNGSNATGGYFPVLNVTNPGCVYYILFGNVAGATSYLRITLNGNVIYWRSGSGTTTAGIYVPSAVDTMGTENHQLVLPSGLVTKRYSSAGTISTIQSADSNLVTIPEPIRFNTLQVEVLASTTSIPVNYAYLLD